MARIDLADFSGGIWEATAASDFTERQASQIKGFIIENEVQLRSQGPFQRIASGEAGVAGIRPFRGDNNLYLVLIRTNGQVAWAIAPSRTASNTTTSALTFTNFSNVTADTGYRFTTEFTYSKDNEFTQGLIVHTITGSNPGVVIRESGNTLVADLFTDKLPSLTNGISEIALLNAGTGYTTPPTVTIAGSGGAVAEAQIRNGKISAVNITKAGSGYTTAPAISFSGGDGSGATAFSVLDKMPKTGVLPHHGVACTWGSALVLGDIQWSAQNADSGLTSGNVKRYSNYIWITAPDALNPNMLRFDPRGPERVAPEGAVITGLQEVPEGLLVMSTSASGKAGLTLVRLNSDGSYDINALRPGLSMTPLTEAYQRNPSHAWWNEANSTLMVDNLGKLIQIQGAQAARIDRYGPTVPESGTPIDKVAAVGSWVFLYRGGPVSPYNNGRLLAFRNFGQDGAWSELTPPAGRIYSMFGIEDTLYLVIEQQAYRYCIEGPTDERGKVAGSYVDLVLGTRVLGNPNEVEDKWWQGVTVKCQGLNSGKLRSVRLIGGSPLLGSGVPDANFTLEQWLTYRNLVSVPGLGPSTECSAQFVFRGDVRVEVVSFDVDLGVEHL